MDSSKPLPCPPVPPRRDRAIALSLPPAFSCLVRAFAAGLAPVPADALPVWAERHRIVSAESGSRWPGRWRNDRVPYLVEPMEVLALADPARDVTFKKSAQVAGSEAGINLIGQIIHQTPAPILVVLPSLDEQKRYVKVKLQPTIDETPVLKANVRETKSRDEDGSTTNFKKFRGGFLQVTGANSSKGLQMLSARVLILEEISEYPLDVDHRGDPVDLAIARLKIWRGIEKVYRCSTPALVGSCRISISYEASDQRRYYVPCPHCGVFQALEWRNMRKDRPEHAGFNCQGCAGGIEQIHRDLIVARGYWIKCYPDADGEVPPTLIGPGDMVFWRARDSGGRAPGFFIWQAYSPVAIWSEIVREFLTAADDPRKLKVFTQQTLGEAWEERAETPDHERLVERRETWRPLGGLPLGVLFLTGAADVQGDRIEWDVYGWGLGLTAWRIAGGVLEGRPEEDGVWSRLEQVIERRFTDAWGVPRGIDLFGIDSGYLSSRVYRFVRKFGPTGRVMALDGRPGWRLPPIGTPSTRDIDFEGRKIGAVQLWPVGTWDMKSELYAALGKTLQGRNAETGQWRMGAYHFNDDVDADFFQQVTSEYLADREMRNGLVAKEWVKSKGRRNERHDTAVYARALAHHLSDELTSDIWHSMVVARAARPQDVQLDLLSPMLPPALSGIDPGLAPAAVERAVIDAIAAAAGMPDLPPDAAARPPGPTAPAQGPHPPRAPAGSELPPSPTPRVIDRSARTVMRGGGQYRH